MKTKTQIQPLPDINAKRPFVEQHKILISCRIRLQDDQRDALKAAVRKLEKELTPAAPQGLPGSTVSSSSNYDPLASALGLGRIALAEVLGSRESIPLITVVNLQNQLDVEVITADDVINAAKGYADYVFGYNA